MEPRAFRGEHGATLWGRARGWRGRSVERWKSARRGAWRGGLKVSEVQNRGGSLAARAFLLMFAKVLAYFLGFALPLVLVRRLSQHEFGLYKQVFLVVSTALTVLPLGFSLSAYYFLPREAEEKRGAVVLNVLCFNLAIGATAFLILLLRPTLLAALFGSQELTAYAPLVGLVVVLWLTSNFLE